MSLPVRPLFAHLPRVADRVRFTSLGNFPTPVEPVPRTNGAPLYLKRDDLSSPLYGGNKVRTLEALFGAASADGITRIHSTGAYGTNHGLAAILHARAVGLEPGVVLFPQPVSECALENLRAMLSQRPLIRDLPHWSALPLGMIATGRADAASGVRGSVMMPGGATPTGGLGYVNAALELAEQVAGGALPAPSAIIVGVGSTCTAAGLLVGTHVAARIGLGFSRPPTIVAVRVTPWPVTSRFRILSLAREIAAHLREASGDARSAVDGDALASTLVVDGRELGWGYGFATERGRDAIASFATNARLALDTTYSAKVGAAALRIAARAPAPVLFWSTKSSAPLPPIDDRAIADAPRGMRRWIERAERAVVARRARGLVPG